MDQIDKSLLKLLQEDSKKPNKYYANQLGLSNTAIYERIKKLERSGIITRYAAVLDKSKVNKNFVAFCHVKLQQHSKSQETKIDK